MAFPSDNMRGHNLEELLPAESFEWLLESAADGIIIVDGEGEIILVNAQAEKLFAYAENELLGKPIETLIPERFRKKHLIQRSTYSKNPVTRPMGVGLELVGLRRDGTEFPVEISLSPVNVKDKLLVMAIIRDVTDYKREHFISETLQKAMLSSVKEQVSEIEVASAYHSAYAGAQVGGDFFDVFVVDSGLIAITIGDVSGKGVEASVYTALAKYSLRAYAYQDPTPTSVMEKVNNTVYRQGKPEGFITTFYGLLSAKESSLSYVNAGHVSPLYLPASSDEVQELSFVGVPVGILPDAHYEQHNMQFRSGDRMLLCSDGVTEARGENDFFGIENLVEFFRTRGREKPDDFISHLVTTIEEWSGNRLRDDVALLLVSMK